MNCPSCGLATKPNWTECPKCETVLPRRCSTCGAEVEPDWRKCPECKAVLSTRASAVGSPGAFTRNASGPAKPFLTQVDDDSGASDASVVASGPSSGGVVRKPTTPVLEAGTVLGKYRLERLLGTGAYGAVYAAHDLALNEPCALKAMGTFGDPEALRAAVAAEYTVQRDIRERAHVLESYPPDVVDAFGLRWVLLPMELGVGTFRDWLREKRGKQEHLAEGLTLLRQAVTGLQVLHAAGIVHRDVKPENLILVSEPSAKDTNGMALKVGDFGLSSGLEKLGSERPELLGDGIGTPAYMAPEQVLAAHWRNVTPEADAYALGTILFEVLDGERPYSGTAAQIRTKKRDVLLKPRRPRGPLHLGSVALELLRREPEDRAGLRELALRLTPAPPADQAAWDAALQADTEASYTAYLAAEPEGVYQTDAETRRGGLIAAREEAEHTEHAAQMRREHEAAEKAERERTAREQVVLEQATRERTVRERAAQEQAERERSAREKVAREQATREQAAREVAEAAQREKAAREEASRIEREVQARREREAIEKAQREKAAREQAALEQADHTQREAAAREAALHVEREAKLRRERETEMARREQEAQLLARSERSMRRVAIVAMLLLAAIPICIFFLTG